MGKTSWKEREITPSNEFKLNQQKLQEFKVKFSLRIEV